MKVGLTYDLKEYVEKTLHPSTVYPEDALEEYDSPETVDAIASAIENAGHTVVRLGGGEAFLRNILCSEVDFVFNIAEGIGNYKSREAQIPSVLEMLGIPYCGSDPQCLSICLDKPLTKKLVATAGIRTPRWETINDVNYLTSIDWTAFPLPAFVKPAYEGSSKGIRTISLATTTTQLIKVAASLLEQYQQPALVEEFIPGEDVTVGIIGNSPARILGIMRVLPKEGYGHFVYSLEMKRNWEHMLEYECPASLNPATMEQIATTSIKIFNILGCRDFARLDFRVDKDGTAYFLEINPLPGLNPRSSDFPIMAKKMGWTYQHLILEILASGLQRCLRCVPR